MEKAKGAGTEAIQYRAAGVTAQLAAERTLSDLGISRTQSSRWQQLAVVPKAQFEAVLAAPAKPTTTGILAQAAPKPEPMDEQALWLWGRLRDFERDGCRERLRALREAGWRRVIVGLGMP